jgi:hypothetical protein
MGRSSAAPCQAAPGRDNTRISGRAVRPEALDLHEHRARRARPECVTRSIGYQGADAWVRYAYQSDHGRHEPESGSLRFLQGCEQHKRSEELFFAGYYGWA